MFFDTARGSIAVIMVGAMIVSGITVRWEKEDCFNKEKNTKIFLSIYWKGECVY